MISGIVYYREEEGQKRIKSNKYKKYTKCTTKKDVEEKANRKKKGLLARSIAKCDAVCEYVRTGMVQIANKVGGNGNETSAALYIT